MLRGWIVEMGPVENVLGDPLHPYTQNLKESIPRTDPDRVWEESPSLAVMDSDEYMLTGCKFAGRCPHVQAICRQQPPGDYEAGGRMVKCFLYDEETVGAEGVARHVAGELPEADSGIAVGST